MRVRARRPVQLPAAELRRALTTFRPALRGQRRRAAYGAVLALATTGLELAKPWPITLIIDRLLAAGAVDGGATGPNGDALEPGSILGLALIAFAIPTLLGLATEQLSLTVAKVSRKATVRIRSDVFEHLQRLELSEHQREYSGDLLTRVMGDVNMIRDLLFPSWLNILSRGVAAVGRVDRLRPGRLASVPGCARPVAAAVDERGAHLVGHQDRRRQTTPQGRRHRGPGGRVARPDRHHQGVCRRGAHRP